MSDRRLWWLAAPPWCFVLLQIVFVVPLALAVPFAISGNPHDPFIGLAGLGGAAWGIVARYQRDSDYRKLDHRSRIAVLRTQYSGIPSDDARLDHIAYDRLSQAVTAYPAWWFRLGVPVLVVLCAGVLVTAAFRSSPWWLAVAALVLPPYLAVWWPRRHVDRQQLLTELRANLHLEA